MAAILRALRQTTDDASRGTRRGARTGGARSALEAGPTLEEPERLSLPDSTDDAKELRYRSFGLPLNFEMVKKAREREMQDMEELKILEDSDRDACMAEMGSHRSRLTGSTSTRAIRSDPTTEAGWSVKRHVGGQQLM